MTVEWIRYLCIEFLYVLVRVRRHKQARFFARLNLLSHSEGGERTGVRMITAINSVDEIPVSDCLTDPGTPRIGGISRNCAFLIRLRLSFARRYRTIG